MGIIKRQSLKSSIVNYVGVGLGAIFLLVIFPNILSQEFLGFVQLLLGVTLVFAQLVCVGTHNVLFKYYEQWKTDERLDHYNALTFIILLIAFVIFCFLFYLFHVQIISFYSKKSALFSDYYWVLFPLILIQAFTYYFEMYSTLRLRVAVPTFLREVLNRILLIIILFLLAYHVVNTPQFVFLYILVYLISFFILAFYAIRFFQFRLGSIKDFFKNNSTLKAQFSYGRSATAMSFMSYLNNFVDTLIIPIYLGLPALGIYSRPLILGQMIQVPYRSISAISWPIIMEAWERNDLKKVADLNKKISVNLLLIGLFLFALVVVNTDNFFQLLPAEYQTAKSVLFIIAFGRLVDMSFGLNTEIIFGSKYYKWIVYFTIITLAISVVSNLLLIPILGMSGAAIAVAVSLIIFNILKAVLIYKKFHFHCFSKPYIPLVLIGFFTILITSIIPNLHSEILNAQFNSTIASVLLNILFKSTTATLLFLLPTVILKINPDLNHFLGLILSGKIFKGGHKMNEL